MSQSLNVIALISGGKDSIYSILHCLQNGHKVIALANLYPPFPAKSTTHPENHVMPNREADEADDDDISSYMYQTVGHTVIPLYEKALGIPLFRQPIRGGAVHVGSTYEYTAGREEDGPDETESLIPLLERIMAAHPGANAVCSGAMLSTYQRTRVESVALRLGLEPLSFLWRYPFLPPESSTSLLMDMASAGLDARIIKVASGGLDESILWQNLASGGVMRRVERAMARYSKFGDGAALGEGGEFETLALDGPDHLFKGRLVVEEDDRQIVRGSCDTYWVRISKARVEMKTDGKRFENGVRRPDLLSIHFKTAQRRMQSFAERPPAALINYTIFEPSPSTRISLKFEMGGQEGQNWMFVGTHASNSVEEEVEQIMAQVRSSFKEQDIDVVDVVFTLIILRSMKHFAIVNKTYGKFFSKPNPPARVTIACGDLLPPGHNVILQFSLFTSQAREHMKGSLHVQSRSYWAPANIGPYSQARSVSVSPPEPTLEPAYLVNVAGQIPLVPSTMALPSQPAIIGNEYDGFIAHTVLSLQHLWRIGQAMDVLWWAGAVAYLSRDTLTRVVYKAKLAGQAWDSLHTRAAAKKSDEIDSESDEGGDPDLWEERYNRAFGRGEEKNTQIPLPDYSAVHTYGNCSQPFPPFFAAEVEELPRGSDIEWQALLGVTKGLVLQTGSGRQNIGEAYRSVVARQFSQITVFLYHADEIHDLDQSVDSLLSNMESPEETKRRKRSSGYHSSHVAYLDACVAGLWVTDCYSGVIPCRSLWTGDGKRLAAVMIFQSFLAPGDFLVNESV